jgi:hypothetical protein
MFKKTLLALSIASVTSVASAGILTVNVDEVNTTAIAAINGTAGDVDACTTAATTLSVSTTGATPTTGVQTFTTPAISALDGVYQSGSSVFMDSATACTITVADTLIGATTAKYSLEGATANGVTLNVDQVSGVGGIAEENTLIFTVTGGTVNATASQAAQLVSLGPDGAIGGADDHGTFTLNGVVGNTIIFSVDTGYGIGSTGVGPQFEILNLSGVVVVPDTGVTELEISSVNQNTAAIVVDTTPSSLVTNIANQYEATILAGLDGIIDVAQERLALVPKATASDDTSFVLVGGQDAANTDTLVIKNTLKTSLGNLDADVSTIAITGDFTWMADLDANGNDDGVYDSAELLGALTYSPFNLITTGALALDATEDDVLTAASLSVDMKTLTLTVTHGADNVVDEYASLLITVPGASTGTTAIKAQDFTLDIEVAETGETVKMDAAKVALNAGEWKLNGSVVTIPYMPFGENTKVIMRHTSTSAQIGDITVRYMLEDMDASDGNDWISVGVVESAVANGVLNITSQVMDAILADANVTQGKVAIEITTNVPSEDVTVYAAYNVKNSADDRGFVGTFGEHGSAK